MPAPAGPRSRCRSPEDEVRVLVAEDDPGLQGVIVLGLTAVLNVIFW